MDLSNEIISDACYLSEEDLFGETDLASTRAPLRTPTIVYSNFDRLFGITISREVEQQLAREELWLELSNSDDGTYNPEDDLIDAIDAKRAHAANEHADITRAWKERERLLREHGWSWNDGDLFVYSYREFWISDVAKSHPMHEHWGYSLRTLVAKRNWMDIDLEVEEAALKGEMLNADTAEARELNLEQRRSTRILTRMQERRTQECNKRSRKANREGIKDLNRARRHRSGQQSIRSLSFDDWSSYFVEGDERYLEQEALRELDEIQEQRFQDWLADEEFYAEVDCFMERLPNEDGAAAA